MKSGKHFGKLDKFFFIKNMLVIGKFKTPPKTNLFGFGTKRVKTLATISWISF